MRSKHPNLDIAAVTTSTDAAAIQRWKSGVGASLPVLTGVSKSTAEAYGVRSFPTFRVLGADGRVIGSDNAALNKALGG